MQLLDKASFPMCSSENHRSKCRADNDRCTDGERHLKVYHLIARSQYGLMVQILGGLITYLLLAIYCREQHQEPVSISRVRELRNKIANEAAAEQNQRTIKRGKSNKIRQMKRKKRRAKT